MVYGLGINPPVRKRLRKRGRAEPVRAYRHHLTMRLTYLEAEALDRHLNRPDEYPGSYEEGALNRVRKKAKLAGASQGPLGRREREYEEWLKLQAPEGPA